MTEAPLLLYQITELQSLHLLFSQILVEISITYNTYYINRVKIVPKVTRKELLQMHYYSGVNHSSVATIEISDVRLVTKNF